MIWHILKKDLRLMWQLVACLMLVAILATGLRTAVGTAPISGLQDLMLDILPLVMDFAIAFITVIVVQQDSLLGDRQDWLLRPIDSSNVMLAKWAFVIVALHGPLLLIDILEVKLTGIPLARSLVPALSHQLVLFCCFTAPALMVGAMTRNGVGALSLVVAMVIAFAGLLVVGAIIGVLRDWFVTATGYSWVVVSTTLLIYVAAIAALVRFQFRERREIAARVLFVTTTTAAFALLYVFPLGAALKVQQRIDVAPVGENGIALALTAPQLDSSNPGGPIVGVRRSDASGEVVLAPVQPRLELSLSDRVSGIHRTTLPIQIVGLAADDVLVTDWATIRIAALDGAILFASDGPVCAWRDRGNYCFPADFTARQKQIDNGVTRADLRLPLPNALYEQIKNQPVRVTIDFTLTWLRQNALQSMRAVEDKKLLEGIGLCTTDVDRDGDEVEMRCLSAVRQPSCLSASLQDSRTGTRNPSVFGCRRDYAPFPLYVRTLGVVHRAGVDLPFLDPNGLAHYPVDASQIGEAQIVIRTFMPQAHFKRQLVIPEIRLLDWDVQQRKPVSP